MNIHDDYTIEFTPHLQRVEINGFLRLNSLEKYNSIIDFLLEKLASCEQELVLDLTGLELMNSSGIASLSLFLIKAKDSGKKIRILGSRLIHWQALSMEDFQQINEDVSVEYVVHH